ncbi:MAG: peptidylprolyl isomerase [Bacilli bacterium]|nr:peptidylprolyl isomerase [Bacilli bacterium]
MKAIIDIKNYGVITVLLNEKEAPITVDNFVKLANKGFYNGLTFHRVIKNFMIQGGCPIGNGTGGPGYCIKGEFKANGVNNTISHKRGVISMARAMDYDSAGSQFFIMHKNADYLDGQYAAFGEVISGIEVVDAIARVRTTPSDRPYDPVIISSITIE